jgi:hypothetical protein
MLNQQRSKSAGTRNVRRDRYEEEERVLSLDDYGLSVVVNALNELRNDLIKRRHTDAVDDCF